MFNQHLHQQQWWRQPRSQRSSQFTDKFGRRKPKLTLQIFVLPFTRYSLDFLFSVNTSAFRWALWRMFQVFGGLVWILVASTHVIPPNPLGWVMFVSVFCFVMTFLWMIIFTAGCHKNSASWAAAVRPGSRWVGPKSWGWKPHWPCDRVVCVQDFAYHGLAAFFYLSAAVILAFITLLRSEASPFQSYQIDIAAVVRTEDLTLKEPKRTRAVTVTAGSD